MRSLRIGIVGSGFSGIAVAHELRRAGVTDLVLWERADQVGGVWRDNTYPGAACDVPSHLYSFSWAPGDGWSRRFAPGPEICAYLQQVARTEGLLPFVRFGVQVQQARWTGGRWTVALSDGTSEQVDVLVTATGQLSTPSVPDLPGLADFAGERWHTARWRHDVGLTGRRVAVVGTGASSVQVVPAIAPAVAHLDVFQRTPTYVLPKDDPAYDGPLAPLAQRADRLRQYLETEVRSLGFNTSPRLMELPRRQWLAHLERTVPDPALRARLTPTDPLGCRRILQSDQWYPALQLPHVDLVTEPLQRIEPDGLRTADGVLHPADVLVLATGFAATQLVAPLEVVGRDGRLLADAWAAGPEAHLGTMVAGFPNLFTMYGPNTNLGHSSIILMLEAQARLVTQAVRLLRDGAGSVEVRHDAMRRWNDRLQSRLSRTVFAGGCRSWYLTADGRNTQNWPGSTLEFRLRTRRLRRQDLVVA